LSWITVLRKRENYRKAFAAFDPEKVARFSSSKVEKLLLNPGIIRNRAKVEAAVSNAKVFLKIQEKHQGFHKFIWDYVDGEPVVNRWKSLSELQPTSAVSDRLAKDMKTLGFKFLGSTVLYAHMQATGMVNDHLQSCFRWKQV
jgi:DNA-3-methyladenine glycosylase I